MPISFASGDGDGDGRNPEVWGCDKKGGTVSLQLQSEEDLLRYPALQHSLTSLSRFRKLPQRCATVSPTGAQGTFYLY